MTTGLRFHPVEIVLSMAIKLAVVAALDAPAVAVLLFKVLLNATALFNRANIRLPAGLDRVLRWVVVTPDMHRVHHSVILAETNSSFGFYLPWWDHLLCTYRAQFTRQLIQVMLAGFAIGMMRTVIPALAEYEFGVTRSSFRLLTST